MWNGSEIPAIICVYEYEVEGRKYKKKYHFPADYLDREPWYPETITMCYDKHRPSKAYAEDEARYTRTAGCLCTIFYTLFTMAMVLIIFEYVLK